MYDVTTANPTNTNAAELSSAALAYQQRTQERRSSHTPISLRINENKAQMNNLSGNHASSRGYTIDQTILIVAIIAILVTIIIISVGWSLLNKASGSKLASQLRQVEDAAGQFYGEHRMWPYQATDVNNMNGLQIMRTLTGVPGSGDWSAGIVQANIKNLLPGFRISGTVVSHSFANGGQIKLLPNIPDSDNTALPGGDLYLVVQFNNVPLAEAISADLAIDGRDDNDMGRLLYAADNASGTTDIIASVQRGVMPLTGSAPSSGNVVVAYIANLIQ